ncbi:MAG: outer membrane beta-barrel protein [Bacteroidales bacterium]|nr:outer membrane beta-barrel protein [Bacteroidales bacterium]
MKRNAALAFMLLIPSFAFAQFEQKVSLNISAGTFKTIGPKKYVPEWATEDDEFEPCQMPNYRPGLSGNISFQYNINRHISISAEAGYCSVSKWEYIIYEEYNYHGWEICDTTGELIRGGQDELTLSNVNIGLGARYYLITDKKIKPYVFAGLGLHITRADFTDNRWQAENELDLLEPDDSGPDEPWLEESIGFGVNPGLGLEYSINDWLGIFLQSGYSLVILDKSKFKTPDQEENLHMISLQAGIRSSFWKSKEL